MSILARLRSAFSGKKRVKAVEYPVPPELAQKAEGQTSKTEEIKLPQGERKEKQCPHCHAPNDDFVSTCWMCKNKI